MNKPLDKQLAELDIFSLLLFRAIFETGHANIAARQLDVSAPKVSRALASLRLIFADELFYRRQQGFRPTPLAEQIYPAIRELTDSINLLGMQLKDHQAFHRQECQVFDLAVSSGILTTLALEFNRREGLCPSVVLHHWQENTADRIHAGELDLGLALAPEPHTELSYERLCDAPGLCLVGAANHPIWQYTDICLEHICEYPFLCMNYPGFNDKVDPLELFCHREGLIPPTVLRVTDKEEWFGHLLCQHSLAFASPLEWGLLNALPGVEIKHLPAKEISRLHSGSAVPGLYLIEKPAHHRRYSPDDREKLLHIISLTLGLVTEDHPVNFSI
ncbi:LysR family transcriptional regulator [Shewanella amazonensis]|uniref:Transcriptional regulator, LysR family n=1 Tax=Shewanella amazonensis (strain ATCC BAA-1098 / SB2B) TaxID=326297 RepID=A1S7S6_SHEAM|nr:transcriptional regulator, LysR family [Shewanella amazonensis SB2B]